MTRDADEIRHEIDQTREELGETLEAIGARVAPGHVAQRVKEDVDDRLDVLGDKVSPARILRRRTEELRTALRRVTETSAAGSGEAGGAAAVADAVRRACSTAAEEVSSAPPPAQAVVALGGGLALTAVLPSFARRRATVLVLGAAVAAFAMARLAGSPGTPRHVDAAPSAGPTNPTSADSVPYSDQVVGAEGVEPPTASL